MSIKNSVIGMDPFWWEEIDYDVLVVFENPHYFSSDGKQNISLSGEIDTESPKKLPFFMEIKNESLSR